MVSMVTQVVLTTINDSNSIMLNGIICFRAATRQTSSPNIVCLLIFVLQRYFLKKMNKLDTLRYLQHPNKLLQEVIPHSPTDPLQTSRDVMVSLWALSSRKILWHHTMMGKRSFQSKEGPLVASILNMFTGVQNIQPCMSGDESA